MTVLSTLIIKPVNGRQADAVAQIKQYAQVALDSGANNAVATRVLTGPNVGTLQMRMFTDDLEHLGEVAGKMYSSDFYAASTSDSSPSGEVVNIIRSSLAYRAKPDGSAGADTTVGNVVALQVHPGRGEELANRLIRLADAWAEVGASQAHVTSAISGTAGPHMFISSYFTDYAALNTAWNGLQDTPIWQNIRTSTSPAGTIIGNFHMGRL